MLLSNLLHDLYRRVRSAGQERELERALAAQSRGDVAGMRAACEAILSRNPRNARAHFLLGTACGAHGDLAAGLKHLALAVTLEPGFADAHANLANVHKLLGEPRAAEAGYRRALLLEPGSAAPAFNLGVLLKAAGRQPEALELLSRAHAAAPQRGDALWELVMLLTELDRFEEARTVAETACARNPGDPVACKALGVVFQHLYDPQAALAQFDRALAIDPQDAATHALRGIALQELLRLDDAVGAYDRALEIESQDIVTKWRRSLVRLMRGQFASGWRDYELRHLSDDRRPRRFGCRRWLGEPLAGKTILVHAEQGLGDEIMFASCIPDLISAGARCIIDCHPKLRDLFAKSFPGALIHAGLQAEDTSWLASYPTPDFEIPAGSVPLHLRENIDRFPRHAGYLVADGARVARWRGMLDQLGPGLKVGLSWRGGWRISRAPLRSLGLEQMLPILRARGVQFVNLQYSSGADELAELEAKHNVRIVHWQDAIDDYNETAALVCALDLVLSVCTAVVHLGGALGRPVWVMTPFSPEWRYGHAGDSMVWYPSVRLVRQPRYGEWQPVIGAVARALGERARAAV